jgi:hypothetical protein
MNMQAPIPNPTAQHTQNTPTQNLFSVQQSDSLQPQPEHLLTSQHIISPEHSTL